jgi:hypothetical protein
VELARALHSVPEHLLGSSLYARVDSQRCDFLVSRRPQVTRRAMISRTQVRSAKPPCVCTVRIRRWSSAG